MNDGVRDIFFSTVAPLYFFFNGNEWFWCLVLFEGLNLGIFLVGLRVEKKFTDFFFGFGCEQLGGFGGRRLGGLT
jgi:hypothetical protein